MVLKYKVGIKNVPFFMGKNPVENMWTLAYQLISDVRVFSWPNEI